MAQTTRSSKSGALTSTGAKRQLGNDQARKILLERYALLESPRRKLTNNGLAQLIGKLGYVQIDSISTIERAHHMILAARTDGYRPEQLWTLAEKKRLLFENWTHDASLLPMQFFPYWRCRFERCREPLLKRWRNWREAGFEERFDKVLNHIRDNGPVRSRDLSPKRPGRAGGWWDWHPDKSALEFLWRTGRLAVTRRENFQKVYDLTERVVPPQLCDTVLDHDEMISWACENALERLGFGSAAEIAGFWDSVTIPEVRSWAARQPRGRIETIEVEGARTDTKRCVYALSGQIDETIKVSRSIEPPKRLRIINPFDPLIRNRQRLSQIFGFEYRIEVFVPEKLRQYGYYVCPILEGSRIIGRIDMRHQRDRRGLVVRKVWWEPGIKAGSGRMARLESELERWRRFISAEKIVFEDNYRDPDAP